MGHKDLCEILEITNVADLKTRLDQRDLGSTEVWSANNNRDYEVSIVNESGL